VIHVGWNDSELADHTGRTVVITGASAGLGQALATKFAQLGADVVLAVRNVSKGEQTADRIRSASPGALIRVLEVDLASLASIHSFGAEFVGSFDRLDLLINNAGVYGNTTDTTAEGFGLMMGVGHLGHFALTGAAIDRLIDTPDSRIVTVSSSVYRRGGIALDRFHTPEAGAKGAYGNVKLANMLFMLELQRRLPAGSSTFSVAAGPGGTKTDGMRTGIASIPFAPLRWMADAVTNAIMLTPEQGILPVLRAATDPDAAGGDYFTPSGFMSMRGEPEATPPKGTATDAQLARDLWERSVELTGVAYEGLER